MAHEEMHAYLAECMATGEFVAIHPWGDDPSIMLVGVVTDLTPTRVTFRTYDTYGTEEEEPLVYPLRRCHTIRRGTQYLRRLEYFNKWGALPESPGVDSRKPKEIRQALEEAAERGAVIHLWTAVTDKQLVRVVAVGKETVDVIEIDDQCREDGRHRILLRRVVRVRTDGHRESETRLNHYWREKGLENTVLPLN